ncbi:MAG: SHOCT domain-containing protein [Lachnospiraceae bacterium]|nr:SHOCT domain-containing protein [Lachnospiraceae bacterium]
MDVTLRAAMTPSDESRFLDNGFYVGPNFFSYMDVTGVRLTQDSSPNNDGIILLNLRNGWAVSAYFADQQKQDGVFIFNFFFNMLRNRDMHAYMPYSAQPVYNQGYNPYQQPMNPGFYPQAPYGQPMNQGFNPQAPYGQPMNQGSYPQAQQPMNQAAPAFNPAAQTPEPQAVEPEPTPADPYQEVAELKKLLDDGTISQQEFDEKKKEILGL